MILFTNTEANAVFIVNPFVQPNGLLSIEDIVASGKQLEMEIKRGSIYACVATVPVATCVCDVDYMLNENANKTDGISLL